MTTYPPLRELCRSASHPYPVGDADWDHYLQDHWRNLMGTADILQLTAHDEYLYRFRPARLMRDKGYPAGLTWLMLKMNGVDTDRDFKGRQSLILPNLAHLKTLLDAYRATAVDKRRIAASMRG